MEPDVDWAQCRAQADTAVTLPIEQDVIMDSQSNLAPTPQPAEPAAKRPPWRPSKYRPEYCELVIEMGSKGFSVVEMAAEIGVARSTMEGEWTWKYQDFSEALEQARQLSQLWWERIGRNNLLVPKDGGTFSQAMWSRSMAARFPRDWRENKTFGLEGPDGKPLTIYTVVERVIVDPKKP